MARQRNNERKRDDAWWLEQWQKSVDAQHAREKARLRRWPGHLKEHEGRAPYSAWLVVPSDAADYGLRPLGGGAPYWASPFIWTESLDPSGNPVAGEENHLVARVFNLGAASAAPTRVDFYWADPSVGLGAADAHFIGSEFVEIQPMSSRVVRCATPWVPTYLNGGHECVFVHCDNHVLDPLRVPFAPWADRHVGQKNLTVLPATSQAFMVWVPGIAEGVRGTLRAMALRGRLQRMALPGAETPAQLYALAAARLLGGAFPRQATVRRVEAARPRTPVTGRVMEVGEVLASVELDPESVWRAHEASECCDCGPAANAGEPLPADRGTGWGGTRVLDVEAGAGMRRRVVLKLRELALEPGEFVVLNLTYVAAGGLRGGYVLVLAPPDRHADPSFHSPKDDPMQTSSDKGGALQALVVEQFPQAKLTLEVARTLQKHLPLTSVDELRNIARYGNVVGTALSPEWIESLGLKELLPIRDERDLVRKIAGVMNVLAHVRAQGLRPGIDPVADAAAQVLGQDGRGSIPSHHFSGPSVFGTDRGKGE